AVSIAWTHYTSLNQAGNGKPSFCATSHRPASRCFPASRRRRWKLQMSANVKRPIRADHPKTGPHGARRYVLPLQGAVGSVRQKSPAVVREGQEQVAVRQLRQAPAGPRVPKDEVPPVIRWAEPCGRKIRVQPKGSVGLLVGL